MPYLSLGSVDENNRWIDELRRDYFSRSQVIGLTSTLTPLGGDIVSFGATGIVNINPLHDKIHVDGTTESDAMHFSIEHNASINAIVAGWNYGTSDPWANPGNDLLVIDGAFWELDDLSQRGMRSGSSNFLGGLGNDMIAYPNASPDHFTIYAYADNNSPHIVLELMYDGPEVPDQAVWMRLWGVENIVLSNLELNLEELVSNISLSSRPQVVFSDGRLVPSDHGRSKSFEDRHELPVESTQNTITVTELLDSDLQDHSQERLGRDSDESVFVGSNHAFQDHVDQTSIVEQSNVAPSKQIDHDITPVSYIESQVAENGSHVTPEARSAQQSGNPFVDPIIGILGIKPQETVTTVQLTTPLSLGILQFTQAIVGTVRDDVITGSDAGEALAGADGKDLMTGGVGPDAFLFDTPGEFGKKSFDTVADFDPGEGDKVVISKVAFDGIQKVKLYVANGKKEAKNAASSTKTIIYDEKKGMLYFNENGKKDGFGDGGEFVKLLGAPEIGNRDFVLM